MVCEAQAVCFANFICSITPPLDEANTVGREAKRLSDGGEDMPPKLFGFEAADEALQVLGTADLDPKADNRNTATAGKQGCTSAAVFEGRTAATYNMKRREQYLAGSFEKYVLEGLYHEN